MDSGPLVIAYQETGVVWSAVSGETIESPLAGNVRTQVWSLVSFWLAWNGLFTHTQVYGQ